jgi:Protein of unknown function (DUF2892)
MKKNMGITDRLVRTILALVFAGLYFGGVVTGTTGMVLVAVAAIFALTSFVSFCPLYALIGFSSCPVSERK